jgi:gliding motility-associated protein GldL
MNFGEILESKTWKLIQNYIYSWGASVVLIGALFKLQHLPGAGLMLGVGLSIEAIIFFISAFEPMMDHPDWKRVYPQLRDGGEDEKEKTLLAELDKKYFNKPVSIDGAALSHGNGGNGGHVAGIQGIELPADLKEKITKSIENLAKTASGLSDITAATVATDNFVKNLNQAAASIGSVVTANQKVSGEMEKSVEAITSSYQTAAQAIKSSAEKTYEGVSTSVNDLTTASQKVSESLTSGYKNISNSASKYAENVEVINKNLAALNTAYEMQLKGAGKVDEMVSNYSKGVDQIGKLLEASLAETQKFNQGTKDMNENIQALNKVYGNMLGALNVKK